MIKITDEIREAARRLLAKHNKAVAEQAEAHYQDELGKLERYAKSIGKTANKALIRKRAYSESGDDRDTRERLEAIISGKRKLIDAAWWRKVHGDVNRAKLAKIAAKADEARNPYEPERQVAKAKHAEIMARRPPGMPPEPPPLPPLSEWVRRGRKTKATPSPQSSRRLSDSVATAHTSDSVAVLKALNARRTAQRAAKRAGLKCQSCGKPLTALRPTARYCNATCRKQAWRAKNCQ